MPRLTTLCCIVLPMAMCSLPTFGQVNSDGQITSDTRQQVTPTTNQQLTPDTNTQLTPAGRNNPILGNGTNAQPNGNLTNPATKLAQQAANRQALMNWYGAPGAYGYRPVPWFADAGVQKQLHLNSLQYRHLHELYGNRYADYLKNLRAAWGQELNATERAAQLQTFRSAFVQDLRHGYAKVIDDPTLQRRFNQLDLQYQGLNAFTAPSVQEHLNLTSRHVRELDDLAQTLNDELREIAQHYREFPDQIPEQLKRVMKDRDLELRRILGRERFAQWDGMIGDRQDFAAETYFGEQKSSGGNADERRNPQRANATSDAESLTP